MNPSRIVFFAALLVASPAFGQARTTVEAPPSFALQRIRSGDLYAADSVRARYGIDRSDRWTVIAAAFAVVIVLLVVVIALRSTETRGARRTHKSRRR